MIQWPCNHIQQSVEVSVVWDASGEKLWSHCAGSGLAGVCSCAVRGPRRAFLACRQQGRSWFCQGALSAVGVLCVLTF
jgi:hypothetical protein